MLQFILRQCADRSKTYYAGGYSMAGLFSLWAVHQTDAFVSDHQRKNGKVGCG